jgi:hypothetical protein
MPYAWAPIHLAEDHEGGKRVNRRVIKPGEEVSKSDFTDEDWEQFNKERIIRKEKYPEDVKQGESVRTAIIRKANEARDEALATAPDYGLNDDTKENDESNPRRSSQKPWER